MTHEIPAFPAATAAPPSEASDWVRRWSHLVAPGARLLDLACGAGRHLRWFAGRGARVTGVDRAADAVAAAAAYGEALQADLEADPWPLPGRAFDAIVVTHYLHRPLLPRLIDSLAPGGVLIYETFAQGQEQVGRPARAEFLLRPGELLEACRGLQVVAYEDGWLQPPRRVQRIVARRAGPAEAIGQPALAATAGCHTGPLHLQR